MLKITKDEIAEVVMTKIFTLLKLQTIGHSLRTAWYKNMINSLPLNKMIQATFLIENLISLSNYKKEITHIYLKMRELEIQFGWNDIHMGIFDRYYIYQRDYI